MATQTERSEHTSMQILLAATELFAGRGYAGTSLQDIVKKTGLTTGAIYHHFGGKKGLFVAATERMEQILLDEVTARSASMAPGWARFETSVMATLEICARPDIQRIVFRDAPTVIGMKELREIEIRYGFGMMHKALQALQDNGIIAVANTELTAQMLLGAIIEAAHYVATSSKKARAVKDAKQTMQTLLSSLPKQ